MTLSRTTPFDLDGMLGTAAAHESQNTTTPFVDQNQTYTSHRLPPGVPTRIQVFRRLSTDTTAMIAAMTAPTPSTPAACSMGGTAELQPGAK